LELLTLFTFGGRNFLIFSPFWLLLDVSEEGFEFCLGTITKEPSPWIWLALSAQMFSYRLIYPRLEIEGFKDFLILLGLTDQHSLELSHSEFFLVCVCVYVFWLLSNKHKIQSNRFKQICSALIDELTSFFFAFQQFKENFLSLFLSFFSVRQHDSFGVEYLETRFTDFPNSESKISRSDSEISFEISCQKCIRNFVAGIRFWSSSSPSSAWWQMFQKQTDEHTSIGICRKRESESSRPDEHLMLPVCAWDWGTPSFLPLEFFSFVVGLFCSFLLDPKNAHEEWEKGSGKQCTMLKVVRRFRSSKEFGEDGLILVAASRLNSESGPCTGVVVVHEVFLCSSLLDPNSGAERERERERERENIIRGC